MEIAGAAKLAMTKNLADLTQAMGLKMMKQTLQQDAAVLQVLAGAAQPPAAATAAPPSGIGETLDVSA